MGAGAGGAGGVPGAAAEVPTPLKCDSTNALGPGLGGSPRGLPRSPPRGGAAAGPGSGAPPVPACRALSWCAPGAGHGECVAGLLRLELGERLGLQLPGGGPRLPPRGPPACPPSVSMPSEFSNISWMSGGIEPGISIFSVITRSAPVGGSGSEGCCRKLALPKWHPETGAPLNGTQNKPPKWYSQKAPKKPPKWHPRKAPKKLPKWHTKTGTRKQAPKK